MFKKHRHKHEEVFTKDKGRIIFYECQCGDRKVKASSDARNVQIPLGWPKPGKKHKYNPSKDRITYGSNLY